MEAVSDQARLEHLVRSGEGYIYNEFEGGWGGAQYSLLHWSGCGSLVRAKITYPKRHFGTLSEARAWLLAERGLEGVAWRRCSNCDAEPAA